MINQRLLQKYGIKPIPSRLRLGDSDHVRMYMGKNKQARLSVPIHFREALGLQSGVSSDIMIYLGDDVVVVAAAQRGEPYARKISKMGQVTAPLEQWFYLTPGEALMLNTSFEDGALICQIPDGARKENVTL